MELYNMVSCWCFCRHGGLARKWLWHHVFFYDTQLFRLDSLLNYRLKWKLGRDECVILKLLFSPFYTTIEKISESSLRIQSSEKITSISLPVAPAYHVIEFELEVMYLPSATESAVEKENTTNKEVHRKNKEEQKQDNCMATVDQKVRCNLMFLLQNLFDHRGVPFTKQKWW